MDYQLKNKRALVSGSTKGIGFATALGLAREGAGVIINGRTQASVNEALGRLRAALPAAQVSGFAGDLSTPEAVQALVSQHPDLDILVNNLGIFDPKPFLEIPDADWQQFFDVNVMSGVRLTRSYLAGMQQRNWGRLVFISSESAVQIPVEMIH